MGFLSIKIDENRVFGLDILRAIAILFVIIEHGSVLISKNIVSIYELLIFDGVSIFFVLSGFLIGGILIKLLDGNANVKFKQLKDFWIRRWFRTLPNYYLVLLILTVLNYFFVNGFELWKVKRYIFFAQNLNNAHPAFFGEAWSLSVEEWFYIIIPTFIVLFIWLFKMTTKNAVLLVSILMIFVITYFRYYKYCNVEITRYKNWDLLFRKQVFTRLDSIMYGVIGAFLKWYYYNTWIKFKNQLIIIGLFIFFISRYCFQDYDTFYFSVFYFSIASIAILFMLPFLSEFKLKESIFYRPVTYISLISYSMYLLNLSIIEIILFFKTKYKFTYVNVNLTNSIYVFLYWILVIVLSILLYKYYEIPMMKLRDKKVAFRFRNSNQFQNTTIAKEIKNEE